MQKPHGEFGELVDHLLQEKGNPPEACLALARGVGLRVARTVTGYLQPRADGEL